MTPENFCYWLQGRVELQPNKLPTKQEWDCIQEHLSLVFEKQTSSISLDDIRKMDNIPFC